jgi:hypothetical protein
MRRTFEAYFNYPSPNTIDLSTASWLIIGVLMENFAAKRVVRQYRHTVDAPASRVFPLLCPIREYDWIQEWDCQLIFSISGAVEDNCIFTTDFAQTGKEVWVVSRYQPDRLIEFVVFNSDSHVTQQCITLEATGEAETTLQWTRIFTGLNAIGNDRISGFTEELYRQRMDRLSRLLKHYLKTGEMLTADTPHHSKP